MYWFPVSVIGLLSIPSMTNERTGQLDELAKTMCFMIGDSAGFINGDEIRVTGGLDWAP